MTTPKRKSSRRFEQLNLIVDEIALTLGSPAHVAVLLCCFRHAGTGGRFAVSTARIAASCRLSKRQAVRIVDQLERAGVIEMISDHQGPIAKRYRITGRGAANGDTHDTNKKNNPPGRMVTPMTANGDI